MDKDATNPKVELSKVVWNFWAHPDRAETALEGWGSLLRSNLGVLLIEDLILIELCTSALCPSQEHTWQIITHESKCILFLCWFCIYYWDFLQLFHLVPIKLYVSDQEPEG